MEGEYTPKHLKEQLAHLKTVESVLLWAKTPGNHGGNPYLHEFVKEAQITYKRLTGNEYGTDKDYRTNYKDGWKAGRFDRVYIHEKSVISSTSTLPGYSQGYLDGWKGLPGP